MSRPLDIVIFGLTLSSSWGNGHATTYRSLLRGLDALGHRVLFLEKDQPWYAPHRDLPDPGFCTLELYDDTAAVLARHRERLDRADAVIVGSYVPEAVELIDALAAMNLPSLHFYDIDTPVTLDHLSRGDAPYLARRQVPLFRTIFSFAGGRALDILQREHGAREARPLYCSVDADAYRPGGGAPVWDLGYLGTHSDDRRAGLERLLLAPARARPDLSFVVAGPQYPDDIDWPPNVERFDHIPPERHVAFYTSQRFTLNLTRAPMRQLGHSPSVRLFEAAACGTPVISDRWEGLSELLPEGEAIVIADGPRDVLRALEMPVSHRDALAAAARGRILAAHTGAARAAELADALTPMAAEAARP
ncbi:CgeB family protein [Wenxinia marina]|uniref:Spore protein YkvP/CgeB glycosyl transferase-like domain-containing protein n=1 Tax=Wenxinia marina DSM 24838 TaxID=1123501 RepID=A0A0D0P958_9RHOB|nr:glycosyltransferase [Wenxinia marina]KIQ68101.1 hypothetical protein Wenmar_03316 [Wenxinia marina DSM 24838]GGL78244.1 glycosyl transferase [Wenxinia marina]